MSNFWGAYHSHGGIAYPPNPRRSFGRNIQREMPGVPYIRAGAYAPLHGFAFYANPPSDAGWLRSSPVGFAEPFRSVCRNVSGKLPSHPFAALTGLAAAPRCCWFCNIPLLLCTPEYKQTAECSESYFTGGLFLQQAAAFLQIHHFLQIFFLIPDAPQSIFF